MKKNMRRFLGAVLAISAALALLTLAVDCMGGSPTLMLSLLERHAPTEASGLPQEAYPAMAQMIAGYLSGGNPTFQYTPEGTTQGLFNAREQAHMADVEGLFVLCRMVALIATGIAALCLLLCLIQKQKDLQALRGARDGLRLMLGLLGGLLLWGMIDFDSLFILFHRLAFTNDLWLLDPQTDLLIRLMPTSFFVHYGALIGGTWLGVLCLAEAVLEVLLRRASPKASDPASDPTKERAA